jgi:hypothetical protein
MMPCAHSVLVRSSDAILKAKTSPNNVKCFYKRVNYVMKVVCSFVCVIGWFLTFRRILVPSYSWVDLCLDHFTLEDEGTAFFETSGRLTKRPSVACQKIWILMKNNSYYRSPKIDSWLEIPTWGFRYVFRGMPTAKATNPTAVLIALWTGNRIREIRIRSRNSNHRTTAYWLQIPTDAIAVQPVTTLVTLTKAQ